MEDTYFGVRVSPWTDRSELVRCFTVDWGPFIETLYIYSYPTEYCKFGNFREGFFSRKFAYIKSSRNVEITLSLTDLGKSCPSQKFNVANISCNAFRKN